ncbi:MAG: amidohydrolase [Planctomycetes bacterium]|nr:amidohydrolase [Planctomycetota bacterium]
MSLRPTRRGLLAAGGVSLLSLLGARWLLPRAWETGDVRPLSDEARAFLDGLCAGLDPARRLDAHVHLVGRGDGGTGCRLGPAFTSALHPWQSFIGACVFAGAGVDADDVDLDAHYLARLLDRHRANPAGGRLLLLAFDAVVDEHGVEDWARTLLYTPDAYVLDVAAREPDVLAAMSVHPYRTDAAERVDAAAARGAVACKWLPSAQRIDPASPRCDAFYERMAAHDLALVTHAGHESTLSAGADQQLGHPLRLRRALEHGVKVVVAHCGSLGTGPDLDRDDGSEITFLDAFLRLMDEPRWEGRLFGDLAGLAFVDRMGDPLRTMLARDDLHARLVDGSDYPMCAVDPVTSTRLLAWDELLDERARRLCEEVLASNPLAFDFAVKRSLRLARDGRAVSFGDAPFQAAGVFGG